ncbi:hypothetical protein CEB3_c17860 [Peptococcaceae bacterium CEB3]|nr:hypothetical protein CEB3_c17860 [Peptococcaceae bacterium CEB3]
MDSGLLVIGADCGNGYTKISFENMEISYPSLVAAGGDRQIAKLMEKADSLVESGLAFKQVDSLDVVVKDVRGNHQEHYFCGSLAAREGQPLTQWSDDKGANKTATALLLAGIAAGVAGNKAVIYLAVSLPVKNYKRFRAAYEEGLTGTFEVHFLSGPLGGVTKTIQIIRCRAYPEGLGVFVREVQQKGKVSLLSGYQALLGPGFRTTEFILFNDGKPVDELSGSLELGIATAHKRVSDRLSQDAGVDFSEHEIDHAFMGSLGGRWASTIKSMCEEELKVLSRQILSKLRVKWQDVWLKIDNVFISDGGGQVLYPGLAELLGAESFSSELVENPVFATAIGNRLSASLALAGGKADAK